MQLLLKFYDKALIWAQHKHAPRYLAAVSFVEASVFPIPPYFMLAPMALSRPRKAINYALIATVASVFGGLIGYLLGYLVFQPVVLPLIDYFGYTQTYQTIIDRFDQHGVLALLLVGLTPVPFKLVAIGSGFVEIPIVVFFLTSLISRGMKFLAVALLIKAGGAKMEQQLRLAVGKMGIVFLSIAVIVLSLKIFKVI